MSDLDDFFAKKDKNKKNKKKIFLSDNTKSDKSAERSKEKKFTNALGNLQKFIQDEGEWKDFEDEDNKDYSGLKIQTLSIKDEEEQQSEECVKKEFVETPWKMQESENEPERSTARLSERHFPDLGTKEEELASFNLTPVRLTSSGYRSQNTDLISSENKFSALRNS